MRQGKASDIGEASPLPTADMEFPENLAVASIPSALAEEADMLARIGYGQRLISTMACRAQANGASIEDELLASGLCEEHYFRAVAAFLRVPYAARPNPAHVTDSETLDTQLLRPDMIRLHPPGRPPLIVITPEAPRLPSLITLLQSLPEARRSLAITGRRALRETVWQTGADRRVRGAVTRLFDKTPYFSARVTLWGLQGFYAGLSAATLLFALLLAPLLASLWLHALLSLFYFAGLMLRAAALLSPTAPPTAASTPHSDEAVPVYTVLVALYRESAVAEQLVTSLSKLNWPPSRLDIKLVCEARDPETIAAFRAMTLPPQFEIVDVPALPPLTKPKALTYALSGARGEFTVIYDAEDRPHPDQLREAWHRFREGPENLACLQAPLFIANGGESVESALFSLEYAALFRCMLPMLAHNGWPLPLGGTSNHFRTDVLRAVDGWDPFNVTEDADLGLRLHRLGYRSGVISLPTVEDAPIGLRIWLNQRTRWYKGWLQTWLVMMRKPFRLAGEIGWSASMIFHLLIGGMILSSLIHPFLILFIANALVSLALGLPSEEGLSRLLVMVDAVNILGSYWIFRQMGMKRMSRKERKAVGLRQLALPLYWLGLSLAAWLAMIELIRKPFFWAKTPHKPSTAEARPLKSRK